MTYNARLLLAGLVILGLLLLPVGQSPAHELSRDQRESEGTAAPPTGTASPPALYLDGRRLEPESPPVIQEGRTLVPLRIIAEALGARVEWNEAARTAIVYRGNDIVRVPLGARAMEKNGAQIPLDVPARIVNGRSLLPVRAIVESLGLNAGWLPQSRAVVIKSSSRTESQTLEIWGYFVQYSERDRKSLNSLDHELSRLDGVALFQYALDGRGNLITTYNPAEAVDKLRAGGKKILALVHNIGPSGNFESQSVHELLTSPEARARAVDGLFRLVTERGYHGINLDLEDVPPGDREAYTRLVSELAGRFRPAGLMVTVSIPAKTADLPGARWSGAYDYAALGALADRIMLMTYDEHYAKGGPGPVASEPWVDRVLAYATSVMPAEKVVMGLAAYGYQWPKAGGPARALPARVARDYSRAQPASLSWDSRAQVPVLKTAGSTLYYEDAESHAYKMMLARRYGIKGVAVWRLGYEESGLFAELERNRY